MAEEERRLIDAARRGEVEGRVEYVVSPNGSTLTLSAVGPDGVEQMSVFDRADL